jgi:hypothetical protein
MACVRIKCIDLGLGEVYVCYGYISTKGNLDTYGHRQLRTRDPVRSPVVSRDKHEKI